MNRSSLAIRNGTIGLMSQIVTVFFMIITRSIFVRYLGVELLGISSTFASVLNTLSLAELGFQSAVIYNLYKPLAENDEKTINKLLNILKVIYRCIGMFFVLVGMVCLPFLKFILSGVEITNSVYLIFLIQVLNSASSYFLAYKRTLLFADRKEFITKLVDMSLNVFISLLKIYVVIATSNYVIYISLTTMQTILSNVLIHFISRKYYPFLCKEPFDVITFKKIWGNIKNLFVSKVAYYIYSSTDNIVVSTLVSTVSVGFMVNYTTIISNIKNLTNSLFNPITPIIGNMVAEKKDDQGDEYLFRVYSYVRWIVACMIIIPMMVLIQDFIVAWVGEQYLMSSAIVWLYSLDLYIFIVHGPLCDFINTNGLFKEERNIEIAGASCNIVLSVVLAQYWGVLGVLLGTVVSQIVFWIGRSIIVYKKCFGGKEKVYACYWLKNVKYMAIFVIESIILTQIYQLIPFEKFFVKFLCGGVLCEIFCLISFVLFFRKSEEHKCLYAVFQQKNCGKRKIV